MVTTSVSDSGSRRPHGAGATQPGGFLCATADLHPYECGEGCPHCARATVPGHDPSVCELCDPDYDHMPNPHRKQP